MRFVFFIVAFIVSVTSYANNCTTGLASNGTYSTIGEVENAIRCLQSEINSIKSRDNNENTEIKKWVIQVMATTDKVYAGEVKKTFESLGYYSEVNISLNTQSKKKKNWYKVHIGKYQWRSEAVAEIEYIRKQHKRYKDSFVTSVQIKQN